MSGLWFIEVKDLNDLVLPLESVSLSMAAHTRLRLTKKQSCLARSLIIFTSCVCNVCIPGTLWRV